MYECRRNKSHFGRYVYHELNRVSDIRDYWSTNTSKGNATIKECIGRDRYIFFMEKLYFNAPKKPDDASKTYYIEKLVAYLKEKFKKFRSESTYRSIDESMVKYKDRTTLTQFMPMKTMERGIKLWMRSNSRAGYIYDFNIYVSYRLLARLW